VIATPSKYDRRRATVLAFDAPTWTPPAAVVLDTNVVAEALLEDEPEYSACNSLLERLGTEGTLVVFNRLLELELWEVVFNHALGRVMRRKEIRHRRFTVDGRRDAATALDRARRRWGEILGFLDWQRVELRDVADAVRDLMRNYGLQSYDAVHAATLLASGATNIVTRDADFTVLLAEDATIHTTASRLASTRARRRRVASAVGAG
jgi:predicted nucleic acid-binding protein